MARSNGLGPLNMVAVLVAIPFVAVIVSSIAPDTWNHLTAPLQEAGTPAGAARDHLLDLAANHHVDTATTSGQDDPATWRPADRAEWCDYAITWINTHGTVTSGQDGALSDMLDSCSGRQQSQSKTTTTH